MRKVLVTIALTFLCIWGKAQFANNLVESFKEQPRLYANLDNRHSFISSSHVKFFGVKVGLAFGTRVKTGLGYNWIIKPGSRRVDLTGTENTGVYDMTFRYNYISAFIEYTVIDAHPWQVTVPVQLGMGTAKEEYIRRGDAYSFTDVSRIFSVEPVVLVEYRFFRFFGAGIGVGYRLAAKQRYLETDLNSPVYLARLNFYLADMFEAMTSD